MMATIPEPQSEPYTPDDRVIDALEGVSKFSKGATLPRLAEISQMTEDEAKEILDRLESEGAAIRRGPHYRYNGPKREEAPAEKEQKHSKKRPCKDTGIPEEPSQAKAEEPKGSKAEPQAPPLEAPTPERFVVALTFQEITLEEHELQEWIPALLKHGAKELNVRRMR